MVQVEGLGDVVGDLQRRCVVSSVSCHSHHNDGAMRERCLMMGVDELPAIHTWHF